MDTFAVNATDQLSALDEKLLTEVVDRATAGGWLAPTHLAHEFDLAW